MTQAEKELFAAMDAKIDTLTGLVAQLGADLAVQREMIEGVNTTANEVHVMGSEMKKTYDERMAPLLDMAQNHPVAKLAFRRAAAKRG